MAKNLGRPRYRTELLCDERQHRVCWDVSERRREYDLRSRQKKWMTRKIFKYSLYYGMMLDWSVAVFLGKFPKLLEASRYDLYDILLCTTRIEVKQSSKLIIAAVRYDSIENKQFDVLVFGQSFAPNVETRVERVEIHGWCTYETFMDKSHQVTLQSGPDNYQIPHRYLEDPLSLQGYAHDAYCKDAKTFQEHSSSGRSG
jgi:hypothetical protein